MKPLLKGSMSLSENFFPPRLTLNGIQHIAIADATAEWLKRFFFFLARCSILLLADGSQGILWDRRARSGSLVCLSRVWLQTESDDKNSSCQLIKTKIKFERETRHRLYIIMKKKTVNSAKCETTARTHDAFLQNY